MESIKEIANEYRSKNGDGTLTNKELLWFMLSKFENFEAEHKTMWSCITITKTRQKMTMWFVAIAVPVTGIIIGLIR